MIRQIYAAYDDEGIFVYQAFKPEIVQEALTLGTFGAGFSMERMTWIKPSFGLMLHRSNYATASRQEAILKIKLSHAGFLAILWQSVETSHNPKVYTDSIVWKKALNASDVRHQWDPDRYLNGYKHDRRAIQLGIQGQAVHHYVHDWILGLEEVTSLAHTIRTALDEQNPLPAVPNEIVYGVGAELVHRLGISL
jgi:hypothetical protein